jgi:hypothetical protein
MSDLKRLAAIAVVVPFGILIALSLGLVLLVRGYRRGR